MPTERTRHLLTAVLATALLGVGASSAAAAPPRPTGTNTRGAPDAVSLHLPLDFNGDGWEDLPIGAPGDDVNGVPGAGVVNIIYGSPTGLSTTPGPGSQVWHQDRPGLPDQAEAGDHFGASVSGGNFDGDQFSDLAIGIPGEDIERSGDTTLHDHGAVMLLYGSANGLTATGAVFIDLVGDLGGFDQVNGLDMGAAVATYDVRNATSAIGRDNHTELAIGVPGFGPDTGTVVTIFGTAIDPTASITALSAIGGRVGSRLGTSLATGSWDSGQADDLAAGAPNTTFGTPAIHQAGAVILLSNTNSLNEFVQSADSGDESAEPNDHFGKALAVGDINGDGRDDLAVGTPREDIGSAVDAGIVEVFFAASNGSGINTAPGMYFKYGGDDIPGIPRTGDRFGRPVAIADLGAPKDPAAAPAVPNGSDFGDLIIGVPGRDIGPKDGAGAVVVYYYLGNAWNESGNLRLTQDYPTIPDQVEAGDHFGQTLASGNFGGSFEQDLAIGVPGEDLGALANAGLVHALYGNSSGSGLSGGQAWTQDTAGIGEAAQAGDRFGAGLPSSNGTH